MLIEVTIAGWEQDCCGAPFEVGGSVTWQLSAAPASKAAAAAASDAAALDAPEPAAPAQFIEEHHDQTPPDVQHWAVTGTVISITGISYPSIPVPGLARTYTSDTSAPTPHALTAVGTPTPTAVAPTAEDATATNPADTNFAAIVSSTTAPTADDPTPADPDPVEFTEYRVLLDVPDGTELPAYTLSALEIARREGEARTLHRNRSRMADETGLLLEALADDAERAYATAAQVLRGTGTSAVTLEPHHPDAAAIRWARSETDDDAITVQVGDGRWQLPASPADVAVLREFLDAAVAGRVTEQVRPLKNPHRLNTEVRATNGRSWTASLTITPFDSKSVVPRLLWERVHRGEHHYLAWDTAR